MSVTVLRGSLCSKWLSVKSAQNGLARVRTSRLVVRKQIYILNFYEFKI